MKAKKQMSKPEYPMSIETFQHIGEFDLRHIKQPEPSCFNGRVTVVKYRVTVEKIEEPTEVYTERLQKLWDECDNHHNWMPLEDKAKQLGVTLVGRAGSQRKQ
jgi:hypothetical protein